MVCDRDLDEEVREFLQVTLGATVLATGFLEAGGLVALQTLQDDAANAAAGAFGAGDDGQFYRWGARDAVADDVGPPLPCNECKLVLILGGARRRRRRRRAPRRRRHLRGRAVRRALPARRQSFAGSRCST